MSDTTSSASDAYDLLSRPTLDYTDAEVAAVVEDLRRRRHLFLATGKPDKPKAERAVKEKAAKLTAAEKARNSAELLAQLKMPGFDS